MANPFLAIQAINFIAVSEEAGGECALGSALAAGVNNIQCPVSLFLDTLSVSTYPDSIRNKIPIS
jgi:hypothetical protein